MKQKLTNAVRLVASMALLSTASFGQEEGDAAMSELSPLSVTGTKAASSYLSSGLKTSLPVESLPKSISIMDANQIKAQGLKSVGDVIDYTPGVTNSQGEGHRDSAVIRGVRTTQDFYRDGIRDDVQYYRPLYNIEQVEVIRGSDALLSGFGGGYGLINRVSKKGKIGEDFTVFEGSIDTFGETNVQLDKNFNLNDGTAFRINLFLENLENHRDFYYGDGFGVNPVLKYDLSDGSTLDLSYEYLNQERFIDRGIPTGANNKPVESLKDIVFGDSTENFSMHEAHIFRAIFAHELTDSLEGRLSASHSSHDKLYQNLYVDDSGYPRSPANTVMLDGYKDTTQRSSGILSYEVSGEIESAGIVHNVIAGIQYLNTDNDNDRYNTAFSGNANSDKEVLALTRPLGISGGSGTNSSGTATVNQGYGSHTYLDDKTFADVDVLSFYINDEMALTDSLTLFLGVRFDDMRFDVVDAISSSNSGQDRDFTTSPRVGLTFDATNEAMLYAAYSESFAPKAGDQYAKLESTHSSLDPDTFDNREFGVRYDLPMGLTLSAAYFEIEANKPSYVSAMVTKMIKSVVTGFEISLTGSLTDKWFLSAGYTGLDACDQNGNRLREAPKSAFSIWNNYLVSDRLAVNLGLVYQDESLMKNPKSDGTTYAATLPEYTRVDVGASYGLTENTRVRLHVENLFDELYFPHSHSINQASVGAPIHATFGVTSSF